MEEVVVVTVEEEAAIEITAATEITLVETTVPETVVKLEITPSAIEITAALEITAATAPACHLC